MVYIKMTPVYVLVWGILRGKVGAREVECTQMYSIAIQTQYMYCIFEATLLVLGRWSARLHWIGGGAARSPTQMNTRSSICGVHVRR